MREELEARPAAILFIGFVLGLVSLPFPIACFFLAGFVIWLRLLPRKWLLVSSFVGGLFFSAPPLQPLVEAIPVHGIGVVSSVPILSAENQRAEVSIGGRTLVASLPYQPPVMLGDELLVSGVAKPSASTEPRFVKAFRSEGSIKLDEAVIVRQGPWIAHLADAWRRSFLEFLNKSLPVKDANLVDAICFNGRELLDVASRDELARSGMIHLISASGLQVFALGYLASLVLRLFPIPRSVGIFALACVLVVYAIGAGLQPQIVRAVFMTIIGMSAYLWRREPDAISALAMSALGYLMWRPESIYSMAFQLSLLVVGAVGLFYHRDRAATLNFKDSMKREVNQMVRLSAVVLLASWPLVAYYLGVISLPSLFGNIAVCWTAPVIVTTAFGGHLFSLIQPSVGQGAASVILPLFTHFIYAVSGWMGSGWGSIQVPDFNGLWLLIYYGAWSMTYRRRVVQA